MFLSLFTRVGNWLKFVLTTKWMSIRRWQQLEQLKNIGCVVPSDVGGKILGLLERGSRNAGIVPQCGKARVH